MAINYSTILDVLVKYNNNKTKVAAILGVNRPNLYRYLRKMRELGMVDDKFNAIVDENDSINIEETDEIVDKSCENFIANLINYNNSYEKQSLTYKIDIYGEDRIIERDGIVYIYSIEDDDHTKTIEELELEYGYFDC